VDLRGYGKDCAEAEQYARDFGRRRPDVETIILRTQNVLGPTATTSLSQYLSLPLIPTALGFDPRLQFLHEQDAVDALYAAMALDSTGERGTRIFNIAGDGVVYLSKAIRMLGKMELPLLLPVAQGAAGILRRMGLVDFPTDQLKLIVYGRVVDTKRARKTLDFEPRYTSEETLIDYRDNFEGERVSAAADRPAWERELFEYLRGRQVREREKV
jgi:UDP-glucose 4-epimerase